MRRWFRAVAVVLLWCAGIAVVGNGAVHGFGVVSSTRHLPDNQVVATEGHGPNPPSSAMLMPRDTPTSIVRSPVVAEVVEDSRPALELLAFADPLPTHQPTGADATIPGAISKREQALAPPVRLQIDGIGVDAPVVLVRGETLPDEPIAGWYLGTAFPGEPGNVVILGHLNGDGELFGDLDRLRPGDAIQVHTTAGMVTYHVIGMQLVDRRAIELLGSTTEPMLTLMTCAGDWKDDLGGYDMRLVVQARLVDQPEARAE